MTGTRQVVVALGRQPQLEDDAVVDVDAVLDLQVVQVEVAHLVGVAEADEDTAARPSARRTCDTLTRSSPSVVTPSVSMTTAASDEPRKSLMHLADGVPSWLESLSGAPSGSLIASSAAGHLLERCDVLEALRRAGTVVDVEADLAAREQAVSQSSSRARQQCLRQAQALGLGQAFQLRRGSAAACWTLRVAVVVDGAHALRIVDEDDDVGPALPLEPDVHCGSSTASSSKSRPQRRPIST